MGKVEQRRTPVRRSAAAGRPALPAVRGLVRQRVMDLLRQAVDDHPLTLLVAPAGSGKTTAMVQLATALPARRSWYRSTPAETTPEVFLGQVAQALEPVVPGLDTAWTSVDDAIDAIDRTDDRAPTLLLIDDLHELISSPAEATVERLVRGLPPWLRIVAATRHMPAFNHSQLRVSGQLRDVSADVLRWRPWEVEQLFRDFYRMPLRPEDAARLTQRTEGWAAGLQLFQLASRGLPAAERQRLIDDLHSRPGLVREYLTQNVLRGLPTRLHQFMVDTCVLGWLDAEICDRLRDATDGHDHLSRLVDQRLFVVPREDGRGFRYHEVLRAHLELSLLQRDGAAATRARYLRAGQLLEAAAAVAEAFQAYARAESWDDTARLLATNGSSMAQRGPWIVGGLPPSLVAADPWLRLAAARRLLGDGQLLSAIETYRLAMQAFDRHPAARICRDEVSFLLPWADSSEGPVRSPSEHLRAAVRRDPARHAAGLAATGTAEGELGAALSLLLAGNVDDARRLARAAGARPTAEVFTIGAARALDHVIDLVAGSPSDPGDLQFAAESFDHLGSTWLARLCRSVIACLDPDGVDEVLGLGRLLADRSDDLWGPPLLSLVAGIASVVHGNPDLAALDDAAVAFRALGAGTLEAWARSFAALGEVVLDLPDAPAAAELAMHVARTVQVPGAEAIAELALALAGGPTAADARARSDALARELGMALPTPGPARLIVLREPPGTTLTCFAELTLHLPTGPVDLSALRPQGRTVMARLSVDAGQPVHRDQLVHALWPDDDHATSLRRLPVVISTLRRHLEPDVDAGDWHVLRRRGETFLLDVGARAVVDVWAFANGIALARRGHVDGDVESEMAGHRAVVDAYRGELLPEFGPAEWVVEERDRFRVQFVRSVEVLSAWLLDTGDAEACIEVVLSGLRADRYRSLLWRTLTRAHGAAGDMAAAARAGADHAAVLAELGLDATTGA